MITIAVVTRHSYMILRFSRLLSVEKAHLFFPTFSDLFRLFPTFSDFFRLFPTFFQTFSDLFRPFSRKVEKVWKKSRKNPEKVRKKFGKNPEKVWKKSNKIRLKNSWGVQAKFTVANRKILCKNSSTHFLTGIIIHLTSTKNQPQYKIDSCKFILSRFIMPVSFEQIFISNKLEIYTN